MATELEGRLYQGSVPLGRTSSTRLLEGKVILVTGAGSGIGRASAAVMARHGASVVLAGRRIDALEETAKLVDDAGSKAVVVRADLTCAADTERLVSRVVESYGRIDAAFNNAGTHGPIARTHELSEADWDEVVQTNLKTTWLSMKFELRQMLAQGKGAIVNCASATGLVGVPGSPAYSASKHAVVGLTKSAALEYATKGIRVNAVCPGVTRTPIIDGLIGGDAQREKALRGVSAMKRIAEPEEIAQAAAWLCSDAASFVTGAALAVDAGWTTG